MKRIGAHVFWTRPSWSKERRFATFEIVALAVSCLAWRAVSGPIWLFTDPAGKERLQSLGMLSYWDYVNTDVLVKIPETVSADVFWDIGKAVVLAATPPGTCVLELDLIIWKKLNLVPGCFTFLHFERPALPWYPTAESLSTPQGYRFDGVDWSAAACNIAFLAADDKRFRTAFATEAFRFAIGNHPVGSGCAELLFSAQRLSGHLAKNLGLRLTPLSEVLFDPEQPNLGPNHPLALRGCEQGTPFTHLWSHKWQLLSDPIAADNFRQWLIRKCMATVSLPAGRWEELDTLEGG